jgi:hypothetical protein
MGREIESRLSIQGGSLKNCGILLQTLMKQTYENRSNEFGVNITTYKLIILFSMFKVYLHNPDILCRPTKNRIDPFYENCVLQHFQM